MTSVGDQLRRAREAKGLNLADISSVTKVPRGSLAALERDDYAALPATVFVRGFIRAYARCVGLDPAPLVALAQKARDGAEGRLQKAAPSSPRPVRAGSLPARTLGRHGSPGRPPASGLKVGVLLLLVVATALLVSGWLMVGQGADTAAADADATGERPPASAQFSPTSAPTPPAIGDTR